MEQRITPVSELLKVKVNFPTFTSVIAGNTKQIADAYGFKDPGPGFEHILPSLIKRAVRKNVNKSVSAEFITDSQYHKLVERAYRISDSAKGRKIQIL